MDFLLPKRLPCAMCGVVALGHEGWFLVAENRWLDRLKILTWHSSLASQRDIKSACCREHLKALVIHWLDQASLRFLSETDDLPMPLAGEPARKDIDLASQSSCRLLGELSVHRGPFSRGWTGSPAILECILDALTPVSNEEPSHATEFPLYRPSPESPHGFALH